MTGAALQAPPRRRVGHALMGVVVAMFIGFLVAIVATSVLLFEQKAGFRRMVDDDFAGALAAAEFSLQAETLNGQILERLLGIRDGESLISLLSEPGLAIFADRLETLRRDGGEHFELLDDLNAAYLEGIRVLDDIKRQEREIQRRREVMIDELAVLLARLNEDAALITSLDVAALADARAVLAAVALVLEANGPGQGRKVIQAMESSRRRLIALSLSRPPGDESLVTLSAIERLAGAAIGVQEEWRVTRQAGLARLRDLRKTAQRINGATFNQYSDRRAQSLEAVAAHERWVTETVTLMVAVALIAAALAGVGVLFIQRRVSRRLDSLTLVMNAHVDGARPPIPVDGEDEIAQMGRAFAVFVGARDEAVAELARAAVTDSLTGLGNRRGFDQRLEAEWRRCARDDTPITLILADIDHFKHYNDHHGHLQGDDCLRAVAAVFPKWVKRPADHVARYGGEEFVCVLPDTDHAGGMHIAERLRRQVRELAIPHDGVIEGGGHVTISLGVATLRPARGDRPRALIDHADIALYQAKHGGRDRVEGLAVPSGTAVS